VVGAGISRALFATVSAALAACTVHVAIQGVAAPSAATSDRISAPPSALGLDPFYKKYLDAQGIPITTSDKVPDRALFIARAIIQEMLARRPDLADELARLHERVGIMAVDEMTTDLPEQRDWKKPTIEDARVTYCERRNYAAIERMSDREYWNTRARGMGGRYTTAATENLLGVPGTRYYGENIFVHEFSHSILDAIQNVDPKLYAEVEAAYAHAQTLGLWKGSYSAQDIQEYWAEGTQFWFNSNMAYKRGRLVVVNARDLEAYDPQLYAALAKVYPRSHHIGADVFYMHPARMNSRPVPADGSEQC
jgi:hypothetical protein